MLTKSKTIEEIECFAPEVAFQSTDYNPEHFNVLFDLESNNFWFKARNRIISYLVSRFLKNNQSVKFLEIGCGTGFVLKSLTRFKNCELYGAELYLEGLKYAKKRLPSVKFVQLDIRKTPYEEEFDAVGVFDVLEHIEEDVLVIENIYKTLKRNGLLFISVPQHKWLWSDQDDASDHKRRYSRNEMILKLKKSGFSVEFISSFIFTLLPLMFLSRLTKRANNEDKKKYDYKELQLSPLLNKLFFIVMFVDEMLIRSGFSLPAGGSLLVVARKY